MAYEIGPVFSKPFTSECEAILDLNVCEEYAEEGAQVAFVDDELACPGCLQFAQEQNENENQARARRIRFRGDDRGQQPADTGEINVIRGRE